jgi:hypothetical protein
MQKCLGQDKFLPALPRPQAGPFAIQKTGFWEARQIGTDKSPSIYQCDCGPGIPTVALVLTHPLRSRLPEGCLFIRIVND